MKGFERMRKMKINHGLHPPTPRLRRAGRQAVLTLAIVGMALTAAADPGITVSARQRYPWSGLVDINFTITGDAGKKYDTSFTAKDMVGNTNIAMRTIRKADGTAAASKEQLLPGTYSWVWDAAADLPKDFKCDRVTVTGTAVDMPYSVKFNANGGTGTMANESFTYGTAKALTANAFTRTGYTFKGWATSASGNKVYNDKQSVSNLTETSGAVVNLYAVWKSALYMVIDLSSGSSSSSYPVSYLDAVPSGGWSDTYKTTKLVLRRCEAGTFTMGSPSGEPGRYSEEVQHKVTLTKDFYIGVYEITQKQYALITGKTPCGSSSYGKGDSYPVHYVSYNDLRGSTKGAQWPTSAAVDATSFAGILRTKTGISSFDLPTEAQWEYACRSGTTGTYAGTGNIATMAWYSGNAGGKSHPVGGKTQNQWGLYDMHGNVQEWTRDWFNNRVTSVAVTDPAPNSSHAEGCRVRRGGSWYDSANCCRSADRQHNSVADAWNSFPSHTAKFLGFRISVTLP